MSSSDLYIIAAGNGSRIRVDVPKALVPIRDEPCLTTTLQQIGAKFRNVFVVTNVLLSEQWNEYFRGLKLMYPRLAGSVINLPIVSGLGDGHATLQGLLAAEREEEVTLCEDVVIAWGDVFIPHSELIDELLSRPLQGPGLFPVVFERNPYVCLLADVEMRCVAADFSKHGDAHLTGYHDQSVFRFYLAPLKRVLRDLHNAFWKGGRYITPGGELSLLYSFHKFYNSGDPTYLYETAYPTLSFNTAEEVAAIQKEMRDGWRSARKLQRG